jgi:hypothetical protein
VGSERGVGLVTQFAAELITGAAVCASEEVFYASVALHRQIIEVTHLLAYFAIDSSAPSRWINLPPRSGPSREFQPASLRRAIGAASQDYSNHCELAGHPRVSGWVYLPGQKYWEETMRVRSRITEEVIEAGMKDIVLSDGLRHAHDAFHFAAQAIKSVGRMDEEFYYEFLNQQIEVDNWASSDPLAVISSAADSN